VKLGIRYLRCMNPQKELIRRIAEREGEEEARIWDDLLTRLMEQLREEIHNDVMDSLYQEGYIRERIRRKAKETTAH
jgi:hypothetical protein